MTPQEKCEYHLSQLSEMIGDIEDGMVDRAGYVRPLDPEDYRLLILAALAVHRIWLRIPVTLSRVWAEDEVNPRGTGEYQIPE